MHQVDTAGGHWESQAAGASDVAQDCEILSQSPHLLGLHAFRIRLGYLPCVDFPID